MILKTLLDRTESFRAVEATRTCLDHVGDERHVASTILSSGSYKSAIIEGKAKRGWQQIAKEFEISPTVAVVSADVIYVISM